MREQLSVSELNRLAKAQLAAHPRLRSLALVGEVSQAKAYPSGHFYFTLKDAEASISCVMFRREFSRVEDVPRVGQEVLCQGEVGLYERDGRYQFYARSMALAGTGDLWRRFEALKKKLAAKGYFDAERKRALPAYPQRIGVLTSEKGAVLRDIVEVSRRRYQGFSLLLYPVRVQGPTAARELAKGLALLNQREDLDVIVLARGGGSAEDLAPFNEEVLADAIVRSVVPVVSAVGHETDFTIADFCADLRAPTPSAAAELIWPEAARMQEQVLALRGGLRRALGQRQQREVQRLSYLQRSLLRSLEQRLEQAMLRLDALRSRPVLLDASRLLAPHQARLLLAKNKMRSAFASLLERQRQRLALYRAELSAKDPAAVLARGYAMVSKEDGSLVGRVKGLKLQDRLTLRFADGHASVLVETFEERKEEA